MAVYLHDSMQVFAMDKRQAEEVGGSEPCSRIKRDLLQEIQALQPADRVVVIGCTSEPFSCTKKDSESLLAAFDKHFYVPLPDYATRQACPLTAVERPHDAWQPPASTPESAPATMTNTGSSNLQVFKPAGWMTCTGHVDSSSGSRSMPGGGQV